MARALWLTAVCFATASARNPIVPDVGMADPHAHVFPGQSRVYM
jgi:hypothetical protein